MSDQTPEQQIHLPTLDDLGPLLLEVLDDDDAMSACQVLTQGGYRIVSADELARLVAERDEARRKEADAKEKWLRWQQQCMAAEAERDEARQDGDELDGLVHEARDRAIAAEGREAALREAAALVVLLDERERAGDETLSGHEWGEAMAKLAAACSVHALAAVPAADPPEQDPTEGRSDEGDEGRDSPATRKRPGAEATSESVAPTSSEPSPATSSTTADSGAPGSAATGRPYDPKLDHPERYGGNNPWRPIG